MSICPDCGGVINHAMHALNGTVHRCTFKMKTPEPVIRISELVAEIERRMNAIKIWERYEPLALLLEWVKHK